MSDYADTRQILRAKQQRLLDQLPAIDCQVPEGHLLVFLSTTDRSTSGVIPLVRGARTHRAYMLPEFATVFDGHSIHVVIDAHHVRLRQGHTSVIPGVFATGVGVFCVMQIADPRRQTEVVTQIIKALPQVLGNDPVFIRL